MGTIELTEEEKRRVIYLYGAGFSFQEIAQDMLVGRSGQLFQAIQKEVEKCCVHGDNTKDEIR